MNDEGAPIELAWQSDFPLGGATVRPSTREIVAGSQTLTLEPRVMQVLVALNQAHGAVVSRDVLITRCWSGVIVGDDAIQRCIGRLRKIAEAVGGFEIETLSRIGYRLRASAPRAAIESGPETAPRLAVLPFDNLSSDPDMAYLGDSVADEILQAIARRSTVKAVGRTSSFQFRGADKVVSRIAHELGATHVLDGSVRKAGGDLRISAHLIDLSDHAMLWSHRFDGRLDDIFSLQDEVAAATVTALKGAFEKGGARRAANPETIALIARMRDFNGFAVNPEDRVFWSDFDMLERVAGDDPEALGLLAVVYASARLTADVATERLLRDKAARLAQRALDQDQSIGAAHKALFLLEPPIGAFLNVEQRLLRAYEAAPQDGEIAWSLYYHYLRVGRTAMSFAAAEEAYRIDPLRPPNALGYANALYTAGRPAEAVSLMRHILNRWPDDPLVYAVTLWSAMSEGEDDLVERLMDAGSRSRFGASAHRMIDAAVFAVETLRSPPERARRIAMERLHEAVEAGRSPFGLIGLCARLGADLDAIYDVIERCEISALSPASAPATPMDGPIHLFLRINVRLRQSPRFVALCRRIGLVDYWLATGHWPDCVGEVSPFYDFRAAALAA